MSSPLPSLIDLVVWREVEGGGVVAAAWIHDGGYQWVQSWPSPDLPRRAVAAAAQWNVELGQVPVDHPEMGHITLLRCLLGLVEGDERRHRPSARWPVPVADAQEAVWQVVASGLTGPAVLQSLSWPSLEVVTRQVEPRPDLADQARRARQAEGARAAREQARAAVAEQLRILRARRSGVLIQGQREARERARLGARVLGEAEFCEAVVDRARTDRHDGRADRLVDGLEAWVAQVRAATETRPLLWLLRTMIDSRRAVGSPFEGIKEAPEIIGDLFQTHHAAVNETAEEYGAALDALIRDTATALFRTLPVPLTWGVLLDHGAGSIRPADPEDDEDD